MDGCTECGHGILADTDDWEFPLCYQCWVDAGYLEKEQSPSSADHKK